MSKPKTTNPLVSVLIPVLERIDFLHECLQSVFYQHYPNIEILVVCEKLRENDILVLRKWEIGNSKLRIIEVKESKGISAALNRGLEISKGKYISRVDADDIMLPNRLVSQVTYMENHPQCVVIGSQKIYIDQDSNFISSAWEYPYSNRGCRFRLRYRTPLAHPAVLMRKETLIQLGGYDESQLAAEDYELWLRMITKGKIVNSSKPFLAYRVHALNKTWSDKEKIAYWHSRARSETLFSSDLHSAVKLRLYSIVQVLDEIRGFVSRRFSPWRLRKNRRRYNVWLSQLRLSSREFR